MLNQNANKGCAKKIIERGRDRTPPMSSNRLLERPKIRHSRTKVGNIGKDHALVENVWARNKMQRRSGGGPGSPYRD